MYRFIFFGPPGVGKGSQAGLLAQKLGIPHISTGEMLRSVAASDSPLSETVKQYLETGALVPDELITQLILDRLKQPDAKKGFILDGYPRTIAQAESLKEAKIEIDKVFYFTAPDEILIKRIIGRLTCPSCGSVFNVHFDPPPFENTCHCGCKLTKRADDTIAVISERLRQYATKTAPLIEYYRNNNLLVEIDSTLAIEEVFKAVLSAIGESKGN
jgi:adenylate kinase